MIAALDIFIALTFILGWLWYMKWKYAHDLKPTKKYPQGKQICEFWQQGGNRVRELRGITEDGQGIFKTDDKKQKAPEEDSYRFQKRHVGHDKYPRDPILNLTILQADCDIVSWPQGITTPIDPWTSYELEMKNPFMNRKYVAGLRDQDRLTSNRMVTEEIEKQSSLNQSPMNRNYVYILLVVAVAAAAGAAIFAYQAYQILSAEFGGTA